MDPKVLHASLSVPVTPMDATELSSIMRELGEAMEQTLTQAQFAQVIGRSTNSVNNWLCSRTPIPFPVALLVRYLILDLTHE